MAQNDGTKTTTEQETNKQIKIEFRSTNVLCKGKAGEQTN